MQLEFQMKRVKQLENELKQKDAYIREQDTKFQTLSQSHKNLQAELEALKNQPTSTSSMANQNQAPQAAPMMMQQQQPRRFVMNNVHAIQRPQGPPMMAANPMMVQQQMFQQQQMHPQWMMQQAMVRQQQQQPQQQMPQQMNPHMAGQKDRQRNNSQRNNPNFAFNTQAKEFVPGA